MARIKGEHRGSLAGDDDDLIALTVAADRLAIGYRVIRRAILCGNLPAYYLGGKRARVRWGDVVAWVRSQPVGPKP